MPSRVVLDLPNELLAELAQIEHIDYVKQSNNDNIALVDGLELYAGNDDACRVGGLRLPLVDPDDAETATIRSALAEAGLFREETV